MNQEYDRGGGAGFYLGPRPCRELPPEISGN